MCCFFSRDLGRQFREVRAQKCILHLIQNKHSNCNSYTIYKSFSTEYKLKSNANQPQDLLIPWFDEDLRLFFSLHLVS